MNDKVQCPVDNILINENKARIVAFLVLILSVTFLLTGDGFIIAFLLIDFLIRITNQAAYSLLGLLADVFILLFTIKSKPADRAPKRFAAGVGLFFTILILAAYFLHFPVAASGLSIVLAFFALLESFFGVCAGCYVYTILHRSKLMKV